MCAFGQWPRWHAAASAAWLLVAVACMHGDAVASEPEAAATASVETAPTLAGMWASLRRFLSKEDIDELYLYLRDAAIASLTQREPVEPPPELAFKMAVLEQRARKEGDHYWRSVILPDLQRLAPRLIGLGGE